MKNDILLTSVIIGVIFMAVGWVWSLLVARKVHIGWLIGMAFAFIITLPIFAFQYWEKAKKPFFVSLIGFILTYGSLLLLPDK